MSNTPHTLHDEFAADAQKMSQMKVSNAHFARLMEDYDRVNDQVHRAETRVDVVSDEHESALRRERGRIRDEIARLLRV